MSWLARSLANSLLPDPHNEDDEDSINGERKAENRSHEPELRSGEEDSEPTEPGTTSRSVKEDLSELTQTLTRQFWGVASFLAPPPPPPISSSADSSPSDRDPTVSDGSNHEEVSESPRIAGIRSDFAEIGGRFKSGISILSNNAAVSEISKIASTFLPFGSDEGDEEEEEELEGKYRDIRAIGVTEEVLAFARNIAMHPETWLDFPLFPEDEDSDDFELSNAQQEHALAVESLESRLAALRIELCPSHMSEGCFWKIYFVLLHSRLNKHDAELLSTPQIAEARAMLLQKLQNRTKPGSVTSNGGLPYRNEDLASVSSGEKVTSPSNMLSETSPITTYSFEEATSSVPITDLETEKHAVHTTEIEIIDKSVIEEEPAVQPKNKDFLTNSSDIPIQKYDEDGDDWLEEEAAGDMGASGSTAIPLGNEEDVSFSDLEEDDEPSAPTRSKTVTSEAKDSLSAWVQSNKSSER